MTTFYLIRHGEKETSDELMVGRAPGVHLTPRGRTQARRVAARLRREKIAYICSSPLERAVETAEPLAEAKKLEIHSSAAFHELDMGDWTGKTMTQLGRVPSWKHFCRYHGGTAIPGGETLAEAQARVVSEMIRLRGKYPNGGIAVATHEDPIRLAVCYFMGAPIEVYEHFKIRLGSVTVLMLDRERAIVERLDEVPGGGLPERGET
jgi:broad specificity phosphatase PhoE